MVAVFRRAAEVVMRLAGFSAEGLARGDEARARALPSFPALRKGEGVRPIAEGVPVREMGGVGRLIAGLSHEEKKSSSGSPAGVAAPSSAPSTTTSPGYLPQVNTVSEASIVNHPLLSISCGASLQLVLVLGRGVGLVLGLRVLAVESSSTTVLLEELGGRLITTRLHQP